jgi:thiol-disulfide isomerase/thioredoxin
MDKTLKIIGVVGIIVAVIAGAYVLSHPSLLSPDTGTEAGSLTVYFFYGEECPHCHVVMPLVTNLSVKYPEAHIRILEVWQNTANNELYTKVNGQLGIAPPGVPEVVIGDTVLIGDREIPGKLEQLIIEQLKK